MTETLKAPKVPCGTCPYRQDVPSGILARDEYEKLPGYDGEIFDQMLAGTFGVFMCHQRDGCLCGGWLKTHGPENLLALRLTRTPIDPSVWTYDPPTPCWASGREAHDHGVRDTEAPGASARRKIDGLTKKQSKVSS